MKRHLLTAWLLSTWLAYAVLAQTAEPPKLVIASTEHNIGDIKRGAEARHTFIVKNEGKGDLDIRNVAPS